MKSFLFLLSLLSFSAFAVGIQNVTAKVEAFDEKTVTLKLADTRTIKISKSLLPKEQQENLKPNATVNFPLDEKTIKESVVKQKK